MGKIRDWCLKTGQSEREWLNQRLETPKAALKGDDECLPSPYSKRVTGAKEAPILKAVLQTLDRAGIWNNRIEGGGKTMHTANGMIMAPSAMKGLPDVIGCYQGKLIALEVKAPGGKLAPEQRAKLLQLQTAGALVAIVVDPAHLISYIAGTFRPQQKTVSGIDVL